mgnify:CR=1 FL=1
MEIQWFWEGARKGATFHQKGDFWCPGGCFFGDCHETTIISPLFPPFVEKGTFPPPPAQNIAMVMVFQWFLGGTFSPKSRNIVLFYHFQLFPHFPFFFMKMRAKMRAQNDSKNEIRNESENESQK